MSSSSPVHVLSQRLRAGDSLTLAWCSLGAPALGESLARAGFDAVLFDMQHGAFEVSTTVQGISAVALTGKPALARIPVGDFATASRLLDAGAAGIVAPMINSGDDARAFVSFMKFPPVGGRSWGPTRALALTGLPADSYLAESGESQLAIAMIETREALNALDDILSVDGIDGVLVGPSDLSIALSDGAFVNPTSSAVAEALTHIAERCAHHGKVAAAFCATGARAKEVAAIGFQLCAVGTDDLLLRAGAIAELNVVAEAPATPVNKGESYGN
jgi:4-hydroxy-2-oxoheptanedioate aldolase